MQHAYGSHYLNIGANRDDEKGFISYENGLNIAENISTYLRENNAVLVAGEAENLSGDEIIKARSNSKKETEWFYNVDETSLFLYFYGREDYPGQDRMTITLSAMGNHPAELMADLENILKENVPKKNWPASFLPADS